MQSSWQLSDVKQVLAIKAELGENPVWNSDEQRLYWLDIENATINRFDPASGGNTAWLLPDKPGCFAFREGASPESSGVVIAARDGFYAMDFATGAVSLLTPAAHDPARLRYNDGKTDRQGRLWVGTSPNDNDMAKVSENAYFRYDGRSVDKVLTDVGITNGTAFSVDGRTMFRAQTETRQIWAYDYDPATGTPSGQRLFASVPDSLGMPDGATVDTEGGYWSAMATPPNGGSAGVARFTADGSLDFFFEVPAPLTTMVTFGGPELSTLYITTGRLEAMMPYATPEIAGSLFAIETRFRGIADTPFRG